MSSYRPRIGSKALRQDYALERMCCQGCSGFDYALMASGTGRREVAVVRRCSVDDPLPRGVVCAIPLLTLEASSGHLYLIPTFESEEVLSDPIAEDLMRRVCGP